MLIDRASIADPLSELLEIAPQPNPRAAPIDDPWGQTAAVVISEMIRMGADPASPYTGLIDGERIAVAGHFLGAATTLGVAFNGCCVDGGSTPGS